MMLSGIVLDTPNPDALARFYEDLLGWPRIQDAPDWVKLGPPGGGPSVLPARRRPRPLCGPRPNDQQMQVHLDIHVTDLAAATQHALEVGGSEAALVALGGAGDV